MRARMLAAAVAIVAVAALVAWSLLPGAASNGQQSTNRKSNHISPYAMAAALPVSLPNMHVAFSAAFSGNQLNTSIWDTCYPETSNPAKGCTNFNNPEHEWYMPSQDQVYGGALHLQAAPISTPASTRSGAPTTYDCRSGMVTSYPSFDFQYGYVQVEAKIPDNPGLWPALWLAAANLQWPPEIDILENWGWPANSTLVVFHSVGAQPIERPLPSRKRLFTGWHSYGIYWTQSSLTWYIDGQLIMTVNQGIPHQKMYLIANLAKFTYVINHQSSSNCSGTMDIQSVKVWQQ